MPTTELQPAPPATELPLLDLGAPPTAPQPRRSRRWWWAGALASLFAIALLLRATVLAPAPVAVTVAVIGRGAVEETITNSRAGTVEARQRAELSPEVGGRVAALPFREGDRVARGDVLLRLDDALQRAGLEVASRDLAAVEASAEQACLAAEQAQRELTRNRGLAELGILSLDLLDRLDSAAATSGAACAAARRGSERARAAVELARVELARTVLRAPFAGVVAHLATDLGEYVSPSPPGVPMPPVIDLLDPDTVFVSAPMDEVDAARLRAGLPVRVALDPFPDRSLAGTVRRVAPFVLDLEQQNRTVEIEVELADRALAATLLPGTSADVEVILEVRPDVLRVPTPALVEERRVLVVEGQRLVERTVEVGLRNWDWTEVRGGLRADERVVLSVDREGVTAGALVTVEGEGSR